MKAVLRRQSYSCTNTKDLGHKEDRNPLPSFLPFLSFFLSSFSSVKKDLSDPVVNGQSEIFVIFGGGKREERGEEGRIARGWWWVIGFALCVASALGDMTSTESSPSVVAHRGYSSKYPENTMLAIRKAIEVCDVVEIDVQFTKDMQVVVIHDNSVDRTTSGQGPVSSFTLKEIKELDAGSHKGSEFGAERIPTLDETLAVFVDEKQNPNRVKLLIELKFKWFDFRKGLQLFTAIDLLAEEVTVLIQKHKAWDVVIVQSFVDSYLAYMHNEDPRIETHLLAFPWRSSASLLAVDFVKSYNINILFASREFSEQAREAGKQVYVWTADSDAQLMKALRSRVNGIITNLPEKAKGFLAQHEHGDLGADVGGDWMDKLEFFRRLFSYVLPWWAKALTVIGLLLGANFLLLPHNHAKVE